MGVHPYQPPAAPPPRAPRQRSAGLIALGAALGTLVAVSVISFALIMLFTDRTAMFERGELVGRGAFMLCFWVGVITYAVIKLRRAKKR